MTIEERNARMASLAEQRKKYEAELKVIRDQEDAVREEWNEERKKKAAQHIEYLRENKDLVLSLLEHDRTSCSDKHPSNGYSYTDGRARCMKCWLIEILNEEWGDDFEIEFNVSIERIE